MLEFKYMTKTDQLIEKFKEFKEELNKNVNTSYGSGPNATTGTSGGQGGMYRSEDVEKGGMMSPSPGGGQDMQMIKYDKNGQWRMDKAVREPSIGSPAAMENRPTKEGAAKKKKYQGGDPRHEESGSLKTRAGADREGYGSGKAGAFTGGVSALRPQKHSEYTRETAPERPTGKQVKWHKSAEDATGEVLQKFLEDLEKARKSKKNKGDSGETKHDRCAREVGAKGDVSNPHAVCVAAGVEPEKWKKSADEVIEKLEKRLADGTNREANPKLRASDIGPNGKVHMVKAENPEVHNKGPFKVMPVKPDDKDMKHASPAGLPHSGKDKAVKKADECPKCKHDPCKCKDMEKSKIGHLQGNEAKGFDENKAPGRGTLTP